jgi:hypothetical protein
MVLIEHFTKIQFFLLFHFIAKTKFIATAFYNGFFTVFSWFSILWIWAKHGFYGFLTVFGGASFGQMWLFYGFFLVYTQLFHGFWLDIVS